MYKTKLVKRLILIGVLLVILIILKMRNNDCDDYLRHYEQGDYKTTIKLINKCISKNSLNITEKFAMYMILQDSYDKIEDYKNIDINFLDELSKRDSLNEFNLYGVNLIRMKYFGAQENFSTAIEIGEFNKKLDEELNRNESIEHCRLLSFLAFYYSNLGNYQAAIDIEEKNIGIKEIIGQNPYDYFTSVSNLAGYYSKLANYNRCIELGEIALNLINPETEDQNNRFIALISTLINSYTSLGNYQKAFELVELYKNYFNKSLKSNPLVEANFWNDLANVYSYAEDYKAAVRYEKKALKILSKMPSENNSLLPTCLNNLSYYYTNLGNYRKAIKISRESLKYFDETSKQNYNPNVYIHSLNNLSSIYFKSGNYNKAAEIKSQIIEFAEEMQINNSPILSTVFANIGLNYLLINDFSKSSVNMKESYDISATQVREQFNWLSENERSLYWNNENLLFTMLPSYCYYSNNYPAFTELSYDAVLLSKGSILKSSIELNKLLMESGNTEVIKKAGELRYLYQNLNSLYEKPKSERSLNIDSLENSAQQLERGLLRESKEYGNYTKYMSVTWQDVQQSLGERDVAIEFVEFPVIYSDSIMYAALVLHKGWECPQMVALFEKNQIESLLHQSPDNQYSGDDGKHLYELMWKPLESAVTPGDNVYFSAAGVFYQLALEYLPYENGVPLCDVYNMHRLSSTSQLVLETEKTLLNKAVLYGGIQYDVDHEDMLAESRKYQPRKSLYAYRGVSLDSLRGGRWASLSNTVPEINFISNELERKGIKTNVFTGTSANEESFKALSGKEVNILHLATHGFFLPIEETCNVDFYQHMGQDNNIPDLSMWRSGLVMAGGNGVWTGYSIPEGVDDGILTAQEISVLDFMGMDMVVLSACETALGDIITSEGVFGLQRAFKKAGVNTIVMSLWKVNDEVTKVLMNKFYQTLLEGKSKRDSFLEAQRFIRSSHPNPKDWAAFIMLD